MLKKIQSLSALCLAATCLTACGSPETDVSDVKTVAAKSSSKGAVARACMAPDFNAKKDASFIGFNASTYPAVESKTEALSEKADALRDTDLKASMKILGDTLIVGQFATMSLVDIFIPLIAIQCNYESYNSSKCKGLSLVTGGKVKIKDVTRTGPALSFTSFDERRQREVTVSYANSNYDGLTFKSTDGDGVTVNAEWTRANDGTETHLSTSSSGEITRYTEKLDCSGTVHRTQVSSNGRKRTTDFDWTSTRASQFTLNYKVCNQTDAGAMKCKSGTL